MIFNPQLEKAVLIKRYKRFLTDVTHPQLGDITVHCPNTGSMKNCWQPNWNVWLQKSDNLKRKYPYTWVIAQNDEQDYIGINTHIANQLVHDGLTEHKIKEIDQIKTIEREVKYGLENSRIDLLVTHKDESKTYIEVKSVTLKMENNKGFFPDSVTTRGQKHIRELMECIEQGHKAVLLFMVQHTGVNSVEIAKDIDPQYYQLLNQAVKQGLQVMAYKASIKPKEIFLEQSVPFIL
jgi:sugar fermentation stimulation protein A